MGLVCGCQLMTGPLDTEAMRRAVENYAYGAVVSYSQEVRSMHEGQPVDTLKFSADEERALFQMFAIAEEAANRFEANVNVAQRLGELMPGDTALACIAAAADQDTAFACCQFLARHIAERVPVFVD